MFDLGKIVDVNEFQKYIDVANNFETLTHQYGSDFNVPDYPCMMQYAAPALNGIITFSRNTYLNKELQPMCDSIVSILTDIFNSAIKFNPNRVHLLKTTGTIIPHRDEAGRISCINIGIMNADSAITRFSEADNLEEYNISYKEAIAQDGHGYILNTSKFHSVIGTETERYMITYGFGATYNQIMSCRMNK